MDVFVFIYLPGQVRATPAGRFRYDPAARVGRFDYDRKYLALPDALPVDPLELRLAGPIAPARTNDGLYGVFRDALPDFWGRLVLEKRLGISMEAISADRMLIHSDASRVGNLDFRDSPEAAEAPFEPPAVERLEDILEAASAAEQGAALSPHMQALLRQGTSMGGARPKCLVEDASGLWLAKFPSLHDRWNNARVEMATMNLAASCGIRVPAMRLARIGNADVLLLERFDRQKTPEGYTRLGYCSALSVMGLDESERERFSYLTFADQLRGAFPQSWDQRHGEEMFRRVAFNILARNTDDHPRNHGILLRGTSMELSPAFDVTPTPSRPGLNTDFYLAMAAGPRGRMADMDNLLAGCAHFGLTGKEAAAVLQEMAEQAGKWREFFARADVSEEDTERFAYTFDSPQRERMLRVRKK
jgi:serine/threonine-protein kinase HipA